MNNNFYFGRNSFRFIYFRYKDSPYYAFVVIGVCIIVSIMLFAWVIIPQFNKWFSIRNEVIATQQKIQTVKDNINFMNTINTSFLDTQLNTATAALPAEKDIGSILSVLTQASQNSGISLENYSFELGDIASTSGRQNTAAVYGLSSVNVTLITRGSINKIQDFIKNVQQKLPLSEVTQVEGDSDSVSLTLTFFQKGFNRLALDAEQPYPKIDGANNAVLNQLSSWNSSAGQPDQDDSGETTGSGSAVPLF
jgi:hypothetical protein